MTLFVTPFVTPCEETQGPHKETIQKYPILLMKYMVTQARFERATPSFGGWCSIQLSYWATRAELPVLDRVLR